MLVAALLLVPLTLWVGIIAVAEKRLATKERTLHRSYALAAETQVGYQPQFKELSGPQGPLRYALMGAYLLDEGLALPTEPADLPLVSHYYAERLDALRNTGRFSEARNTASLRTILQGAVWTVAAPVGAVPSASTPAPADVFCGLSLPGPLRSEAPAVSARFFERPGATEGRGLILAVGTADIYTPNAVTTVSVGRVDAGGNCFVDYQVLSTPPQKPSLPAVRVGITADASNIVLAFGGYTQFYVVHWDSSTGANARLRATASTDLSAGFRDSRLPSQRGAFWTDVALEGQTVRLFDVEPSPAASDAVKSALELKPMGPGTPGEESGICAEFARGGEGRSVGETVWGVQSPARPADERHPEAPAYCLRLTPFDESQDTVAYTVSLFGLESLAGTGGAKQNLPLIDQQLVGRTQPVAFWIDAVSGSLVYTDGQSRRVVPWSLDAFRRMAAPVFKAAAPAAQAGTIAPNGASAPADPAPRVTPTKPGSGCGRLGDDPRFDLPFTLIVGDMRCPADADLSLPAPAISPARTPPASSPPPR